MQSDSTYKSIPLSQYLADNEIKAIIINNLNRTLQLVNDNGNVVEFNYSMKIDKIPHVGFLIGSKEHIYFVILNGQSNKNWVWRYTDMLSIDALD